MDEYVMWIIVVIVLAIIELLTINLVTIWFIVSAVISLILSIYVDDFKIQFAVFVIGGITLLIIMHPFLKKYTKKKHSKTNLELIIGKQAVVTEDILKNKLGTVYIDGKTWTAYSDEKIKKDEFVKIIKINGVKLKVEKR